MTDPAAAAAKGQLADSTFADWETLDWASAGSADFGAGATPQALSSSTTMPETPTRRGYSSSSTRSVLRSRHACQSAR